MANKVYNMDGGLHSSAALGALEDAMYGSSVASSSSFVCSAGTGMNVSISTGDGLISTGTGFARRIGTDAVNTVAISAASTASPRIDSIVAYIDNSVTPTETVLNNTNGILKFKSVTGTPAANPVAPSANTVQSSVGAGNPYMVLYNVRVPANATSLTSATFTDMRNIANEVTSDDIADGAVTSEKVDYTTFSRMTVRLAADLTSTTMSTISLSSLGGSTGTRLTQSDGGIKIGSGVSKVRVSSSVFFNNASSKSYGWYELRVNGSAVGYECIANIYSNSFCTGTLAPAVLSVSNGDVITLYNKEAGTSIRANATYLTVEVVA